MPSYEITWGALTTTKVAADLRAAVTAAIAEFSVNANNGTHFLVVQDGDDATAREVVIPRNRLANPWTETPVTRTRTAQAAPEGRTR